MSLDLEILSSSGSGTSSFAGSERLVGYHVDVGAQANFVCSCSESCYPPEYADCSGCRPIRLRHEIFCGRGISKKHRRITNSFNKFTTSGKCQFYFIVTRALIRTLEVDGQEELLGQIRDPFKYHQVEANFSFPKEFNSECDAGGSECGASRQPGFNIRQVTKEVLYLGQDFSKSDRVIQLHNFLFGIRRLDPQWTGNLSKSGCKSVVRVIRITAKLRTSEHACQSHRCAEKLHRGNSCFMRVYHSELCMGLKKIAETDENCY